MSLYWGVCCSAKYLADFLRFLGMVDLGYCYNAVLCFIRSQIESRESPLRMLSNVLIERAAHV